MNARILVLVGTLDTCWYVENKWSRGNISTDGFRNGHAFLYQGRMSPIFWVFAYRHATWIYNRILHSTLEVIQSFLNSCMPEEHALINYILCFVIVTSGFLDLQPGINTGRKMYIWGFHRHAMWHIWYSNRSRERFEQSTTWCLMKTLNRDEMR